MTHSAATIQIMSKPPRDGKAVFDPQALYGAVQLQRTDTCAVRNHTASYIDLMRGAPGFYTERDG